MLAERPAFRWEHGLVARFVRGLRAGDTQWGPVKIAFEFNYLGGYTDVIALGQDGELVAFEAKLVKWRDALHQAYRNLCFADRAYVVLPSETARVAASYAPEFRRRRVGLCSVSATGCIEVVLDVDAAPPLQPWVASRARAALLPGRGKKACPPT